MKFSIRVLLVVSAIAALTGCFKSGSSDQGGEVQYYPPGPEFVQSPETEGHSPHSSVSVPNPPKE